MLWKSGVLGLLGAVLLTACLGGGGGGSSDNTGDTSGTITGGDTTGGDTTGDSNTGGDTTGCTTNVSTSAPLFYVTGTLFNDAMDYEGFSQRLHTSSNVSGSSGTTYPPAGDTGTIDASYVLTWSVSPPLPDGFSLNSATGRVSGSLQAGITTTQTTIHTFRASNSTGYSECSVELVIYPLSAQKITVLAPESAEDADDGYEFTLSPTAGLVTTSTGPIYTVSNSRDPNIELVVGDNGDGTLNKIVLTVGSNVYAARAPEGSTICAQCAHAGANAGQKKVLFDGQALALETGTGPTYVSLQGSFLYP